MVFSVEFREEGVDSLATSCIESTLGAIYRISFCGTCKSRRPSLVYDGFFESFWIIDHMWYWMGRE